MYTAICGYLDLLEQETLPQKSENYLNIIRQRTDVMRTLTEELHLEQICVNDILEQSLAGFYGVFMKESIVPDIRMEIYFLMGESHFPIMSQSSTVYRQNVYLKGFTP